MLNHKHRMLGRAKRFLFCPGEGIERVRDQRDSEPAALL
jgi:hypothetical protein